MKLNYLTSFLESDNMLRLSSLSAFSLFLAIVSITHSDGYALHACYSVVLIWVWYLCVFVLFKLLQHILLNFQKNLLCLINHWLADLSWNTCFVFADEYFVKLIKIIKSRKRSTHTRHCDEISFVVAHIQQQNIETTVLNIFYRNLTFKSTVNKGTGHLSLLIRRVLDWIEHTVTSLLIKWMPAFYVTFS